MRRTNRIVKQKKRRWKQLTEVNSASCKSIRLFDTMYVIIASILFWEPNSDWAKETYIDPRSFSPSMVYRIRRGVGPGKVHNADA